MPIYDQSYAHWKGRLEGRVFRWAPITANGIRLVLRRKLLVLLLLTGLAPFVFRAGMIFFLHYADSLLPPGERPGAAALKMMTPDGAFFHDFLLSNQMFGVIVACLFVGTPLVARDLKAGALEVYFSKPILLFDYLFGKFMVIAFFLACMTLFPALFLSLLDLIMAEGNDYFLQALSYLPGILAVSTLVILTNSLIVLAASSLARTARTAAVLWFGFHMAFFVASRIGAAIFSLPAFRLIDLRTSLSALSEELFRQPSSLGSPWWLPLVVVAVFSGAAFAVLLGRVRGVEVIRS